MKIRIVIEQDDEEHFVAECPSLPGCVSRAKTREEALSRIRAEIYSRARSPRPEDPPIPADFEEDIVDLHFD